MKNQLDVLLNVTQILNNCHIPYMLTGSIAMNFYSEPRMTRDIDFIIVIQPNQKNKVFELFQDKYYISKTAISEALKYNSMFNIIHKELVVKADLIIRKNSEYRKNEFERRRKVNTNDRSIYIVSLEDLIISKIIWSKDSKSELQKQDIFNLLNCDYDNKYLMKWLKELSVLSFTKEFLGERYFG